MISNMMHKTLIILLALTPLLWSCGGGQASSSSDEEEVAEKTALDSLSYLEGRLGGLQANLYVEQNIAQAPDSIKSYYDKGQFELGFRHAMMTDTTSPTFLYAAINTAQIIFNYSLQPKANYAPIDYDLFSKVFSKALMNDCVVDSQVNSINEQYYNIQKNWSTYSPTELKSKSEEFTTILAQVVGLNLAYQINQINNTPDAEKIDKKDVIQGMEYYIGLRPRTVGFQQGFLSGLSYVSTILDYRQHNIYINISDYTDAFIEAFKESGVTDETVDKVREQLSELLNRQLKSLSTQTSN